MKRKGKRKTVIFLIIFIALGILIGVNWLKLSKEHEEAKNVPIANIDFKDLNDGVYVGEYEGGMYKWRVNKAEVTVSGGKVTDIKLVSSSGPGAKNNKDYITIYNRIIQAQSLQVDVVSGATLTSKAYMKAVEIALLKAKND